MIKISRKISRIVGVGAALLAVVAFGGIVLASPVSAAIVYLLAEWLNNGATVGSTVLAEIATEVLLEDAKVSAVGGAALSVNCSGRTVGDLGSNGAVDITEILNVSGTAVSLVPLAGTPLPCMRESGCESSKLWPVNFPWLGQLELWEEGTASGYVVFLAGTKGVMGWYMECIIFGIKAEDECTANQAGYEAPKNVSEGVEVILSNTVTALFGGKLATCTQSNEETGEVEGSGIMRLSSGGPLSAAE